MEGNFEILLEVNGITSSHFREKMKVYNEKVKHVVNSLMRERTNLRSQIQELQQRIIELENLKVQETSNSSNEVTTLQNLLKEKNKQLTEQINANAQLREQLEKLQKLQPNSASPQLTTPAHPEKTVKEASIKLGFSLKREKESDLVKLPVVVASSPPTSVASPPSTPSKIKKTVSGEWSDEEEDEDLIRVKEANGTFLIKGGTVSRLVDHLCNHKSVEMEYLQAFLLTYRSFTTPLQLFDLLTAKFNLSIPTDISEQDKPKFESKKRIIRIRVGNVFRNWIEKYSFDFKDNPELLDKLNNFIDTQLALELESLASSLKKILNSEKQEKGLQAIFDVDPPLPIIPKSTAFKDFSTLEVARQLTIIEFNLYSKIKPVELLGKAWSKPDRSNLSPNVVAITKNFNTVSMWVATSIVKEEGVRERANLIKKFIKMALHCKDLNNFNGVMEILAGLQTSAIHRLKKTWEKLETKFNELYNQLLNEMSSRDNYKNYRDGLHSISPPCVPYLGVYLTDLTFIEDGNLDYLKENPDFINFDKRRRLATVISELQRYQQQAYNLSEQPTIKDYLSHLEVLTEKLLYKFSLICEPRERQGTVTPNAARGLFADKARFKRGKTFVE